MWGSSASVVTSSQICSSSLKKRTAPCSFMACDSAACNVSSARFQLTAQQVTSCPAAERVLVSPRLLSPEIAVHYRFQLANRGELAARLSLLTLRDTFVDLGRQRQSGGIGATERGGVTSESGPFSASATGFQRHQRRSPDQARVEIVEDATS